MKYYETSAWIEGAEARACVRQGAIRDPSEGEGLSLSRPVLVIFHNTVESADRGVVRDVSPTLRPVIGAYDVIPAAVAKSVRNLRFDEPRQMVQGFLPAEVTHLGGYRVGNALL